MLALKQIGTAIVQQFPRQRQQASGGFSGGSLRVRLLPSGRSLSTSTEKRRSARQRRRQAVQGCRLGGDHGEI